MPRRRKSPWTQADVKNSRESLMGAPEPERRMSYADPLDRIAQSRQNLAAFWATEAAGFRSMWGGFSEHDRATLVQTNCPHLARSASNRMCACGCGIDMTGSSTLIPEMILDRLVQDGVAGSLPDVMHRQATADPQEQELKDVAYLRQVFGSSPTPSKMVMLYDIAGLRRGQCMAINHAAAMPGVARMFETGVAIDDALFHSLVQRQLGLLSTLCAYADEFATEWTKETNVYAVSAPMWAAPGWRDRTPERLVEEFNRLQTTTRVRRAQSWAEGAVGGAAGVAAAEELKAQGNDKFAAGDDRSARRLYSRAIDALHLSSPSNASLPLEGSTLLHVCLSNRAQCALNAQQPAAARADARYALTLVAGVADRLVEKTRFRLQQADDAIARQAAGAGRGDGEAGAAGSGRECSVCGQVKPAGCFSRKQWRAKGHSRKCLHCVQDGAAPPPAAPAPDPDPPKDLLGRDRGEARGTGDAERAERARGGGKPRTVADGLELLAVAVECGVFASDECPICLGEWREVEGAVVIPPCGHPVCRACLVDWAEQVGQQREPVCTLCLKALGFQDSQYI